MKTFITLRDQTKSSTLRGDIEELAQRHFSRFAEQIAQLKVRIHDANGPRGGRDCQVLAVVQLHDGRQSIISSTGYQAMPTVADSLHRALRQVRRFMKPRHRMS